jgi:hypothetical protein
MVEGKRQAGAVEKELVDAVTDDLMDSNLIDGDYVLVPPWAAQEIVRFVLLTAAERKSSTTLPHH